VRVIIAKEVYLREARLLQIGLEFCRQPASHDKLVLGDLGFPASLKLMSF
jgi:hypothetical protein